MNWVCDYAWARPDPAEIKRAGFVGVCRYISHDKTGKTLNRGEVDALHRQGLGVVLNFEDSAGRPLQGFNAGINDATFANQYADLLGAPHDIPIYYSCDTDPGNPPKPEIGDYYKGIKSVSLRPVGAYGGAVLIRALLLSDIITFGWTANASSWNHQVPPTGNLHQVYSHPPGSPVIVGVDPTAYDVSEVLKPNFGAWGVNTPPAPVFVEQEDSSMFWYNNFYHDVWVDNDGEVQHIFNVDQLENLSQVARNHGLTLGKMQKLPVSFKVRPDGVGIDGYTVADSGWICHWAFEGNPIGWRCVPYPPK